MGDLTLWGTEVETCVRSKRGLNSRRGPGSRSKNGRVDEEVGYVDKVLEVEEEYESGEGLVLTRNNIESRRGLCSTWRYVQKRSRRGGTRVDEGCGV